MLMNTFNLNKNKCYGCIGHYRYISFTNVFRNSTLNDEIKLNGNLRPLNQQKIIYPNGSRFNNDGILQDTGPISDLKGSFSNFNTKVFEDCNNAYELVSKINELGSIDDSQLIELEKRIQLLISEDMKQNSILILTLNEFKLDPCDFLKNLKSFSFNNNEHMILRSLAECLVEDVELLKKIEGLYSSFFEKFKSEDDSNSFTSLKDPLIVSNYICSYCKFVYNKVVNPTHLEDVEKIVKMLNFSEFTPSQRIDLCYNLGLMKLESCSKVLECLSDEDFESVTLSDVIRMFTKAASFDSFNKFSKVENLILKLYREGKGDFKLNLEDCVNLVVAIGRVRSCDIGLIDYVVENLKVYTNELTLEDITKILINLSKVNYNNRSYVRNLGNLVLTFIDEDSILDAFTLSNLIKSFGRFGYLNQNLILTLFNILIKEEVISEFKIHDLVTVFTSLVRLSLSSEGEYNKVSNFTFKNNKIKYLNVISRSIMKNDINTEMSVKLINSASKVEYDNVKFLNHLIESINLNEIGDLSILYKIKISVDKLSLYYPELTERILLLENKINIHKHSSNNVDKESMELGDEIPNKKEEYENAKYYRNVFIRRGKNYIQSVRKRKWTY